MNVKLSQIIESKQSLQNLMLEKAPKNISLQISRTYKLLLPEYENYGEELKKTIVENGGEIQDDGKWKVPPDNGIKFQQEIKELMDAKMELNISKIKLPVDFVISGKDLLLLEWLLEDEDVKKEVI